MLKVSEHASLILIISYYYFVADVCGKPFGQIFTKLFAGEKICCQRAAEQGTAVTPTVKAPEKKKSLNDEDDAKRSLTVY